VVVAPADLRSRARLRYSSSENRPTPALFIILAYIVVTRIGFTQAAKLGVTVGSIPLFLTDIILIALLVSMLLRRPTQILLWMTLGTGARTIGRSVWLLALCSCFYFAAALSQFKLLAARDLAIFGYCAFFPLTYFAIRNRHEAIRIVRYFTYSGVILSVLLIVSWLGILDPGLFQQQGGVHGILQESMGGGDVGGIAAFSLVALMAYLALEARYRMLHLICAVSCFLALAITTARSAVVAAALSSFLTVLVAGRGHRLLLAGLASVLAGCVLLAPFLPAELSGAPLMRNLYLAVVSGAGTSDFDVAFRFLRWLYAFRLWQDHPIFGVGFGAPLFPFYDPVEADGLFNAGMPHNTYLMILARMGLLGFLLIASCWIGVTYALLRNIRSHRLPDNLAAAAILVAMAAFAGFVLFFERPMHGAAFWILLATAVRLNETAQASIPSGRTHNTSAVSAIHNLDPATAS
jgi:O-antigen ligase